MQRGGGCCTDECLSFRWPDYSSAHWSQMLPAIFYASLCSAILLQINYGIVQEMNRVLCDVMSAVTVSVTGRNKQFFWDRLLHLLYLWNAGLLSTYFINMSSYCAIEIFHWLQKWNMWTDGNLIPMMLAMSAVWDFFFFAFLCRLVVRKLTKV
jgi:hypothetical protein